MKKQALLIGIIVFSILLFLFVNVFGRLGDERGPVAKQGVIDLRGHDWMKDGTVRLRGEWQYYPGKFLVSPPMTPADFPLYLPVPGRWSEYHGKQRELGPYGYGTYRLRILLDEGNEQIFGFYVASVYSSHALYVNRMRVGGSGLPATSPERNKPGNIPYTAYETNKGHEIELTLQVANYDLAFGGGVSRSIQFGLPDAINKEQQYSLLLEFSIILLFLLFALHFLLVYVYRSRRDGWLYFILFCLMTALYVSTHGEKWLARICPDISYVWNLKLLMISGIGVNVFLLLFVCKRYGKYAHPRIVRGLLFVIGAHGVFYTCTSIQMFTELIWLYLIVHQLCAVYTLYILVKAALQEEENHALYEFAIALCYKLGGITEVAGFLGIQELGKLFSLQLFVMNIAFSALMAHRFVYAYQRTEQLSNNLKRIDQMKDEFMAHTSHELRTPLHAIINIAHSLLEGGKSRLSRKQADDLKLVVSVGRQMARLLNDLLDWSKLRAGSIAIAQRSVELSPQVMNVWEILQYAIPNPDVRLRNRIPPDMPAVWVDEQRLVQILTNLLHNAAKHTARGMIIVDARQLGKLIEVRVSDTGSGVPVEKQSIIFDAYEQADSHHALLPGVGLGLSITKKLVELHGGKIGMESIPGHGSVFYFTLPVSTRRDGVTEALPLPHTPEKGFPFDPEMALDSLAAAVGPMPVEDARILIVDDDPVNLRVLENLLSLDNLRVMPVSNGMEALEELRRPRGWDLVILDVMMPGLSGIEVCREIRKQHSLFDLPILMLTASGRPDDVLAAFSAGANDFLTKAVESSELRARVRTILQMKQSVADRIRMELAFLQAQIKPHFLFNTLNTIAALSEDEPERTRELLVQFGTYLRESFRFENVEPLIPLHREMQLVKAYLHIEQIRYEDRLKVTIDVPEHLDFPIPPLTIQPIVENAVRHGVMKRSEGGEIMIRIREDGPDYVLTVKDNGVGFSPERLAQIMTQDAAEGIGFRNIERRMKQLYGRGMSIASEQEKETSVELRFPRLATGD